MDFDDYGGDEDYDHNYFYVEDSYDAADDLAEHAIPSPQPFDDDDEWDELSRFEYWADIEYDSDGWNDVEPGATAAAAAAARARRAPPPPAPHPPHPTPSTKAHAGQKRKAEASTTSTTSTTTAPSRHSPAASKRAKLAPSATEKSRDSAYIRTVALRERRDEATIRWRTAEERRLKPEELTGPVAAQEQTARPPFALLKDWKVRFSDDVGFDHAAAVPPPAMELDGGEEVKGPLAAVAEGEAMEEDGVEATSSTTPNQLGRRDRAAVLAAASPAKRKSAAGRSASERLVPVAAAAPTAHEESAISSLLASSGLDPAILRAALEANLAASGAAPAMNTEMLLGYAMRMLGGEQIDDVAGELAEELLGAEDGAEEDEESEGDIPAEKDVDMEAGAAGERGGRFKEWVSRQKAREEEAKMSAVEGLRKDSSVHMDEFEAPPSDAEALDGEIGAAGREVKRDGEKSRRVLATNHVVHVESDTSKSKKRKKTEVEGEEQEVSTTKAKRERRGYEMPTATSRARTKTVPPAEASSGKKKG